MKVTDDQIVSAIWATILKELPRQATHNFIGGKFGICRDDDFWARSCTDLCTVWRKKWMGGLLSESQSLRRIKLLTESGRVFRESRGRSGASFHIWLDVDMSTRAFKRCLELLRERGLSETPQHIDNIVTIHEDVSGILVSEFGGLLP